MFIDKLIGLLALYKVVSGKIAVKALFNINSIINSVVVNKV